MRHFNLKSAQVFDEFPVWKTLMFLPEAARKQAFADPATREKLRADLAAPRRANFHRRWDLVRISAVHKLTFQVASVYGLEDRGLLRPGYAADLAIFDPATVQPREAEWVTDYPAQTRRLVQGSEGVHYTVVNGRGIQENGRLSGELPGQVLRGSAYRALVRG